MNLYFADKPRGLTTHSSLNENERGRLDRDPNDGFLELLSARLEKKLWPIHRLDRETSGAIAFAEDKETAAKARELFEAPGRVSKEYFFLTDKNSDRDTYEIESNIERVGSEFVSSREKQSNSKTTFTLVRKHGRYSLWSAKPHTGKPHQIRLHAEDAGIEILGDVEHGGSEFPVLCLTSRSIEIEGQRHDVALPRFFEELSLVDDTRLCRWLAAIERRERWWNSLGTLAIETTARRLVHSDGDPLRIEKLDDVTWLNWFSEREPNESEWKSIRKLVDLMGWKKWTLQLRSDRGKAPNEASSTASTPPPDESWTAKENGLSYEFRRDSGLSPGLFLDQRRNREWMKRNARGKSVLNLFCYTAGFSVAAAAGGATKVVSVDVSKTFLEWGKKNFSLNSLSLEGHEFRAMDGREYLAWAAKKGLTFDVVVCDPPSFSRSKSGLFKIDKDFDALFASALTVVAPGGTLLFACNYEGWDEEEFFARATRASAATKVKTRLSRSWSPDPDFELPREVHNMKSILASRS